MTTTSLAEAPVKTGKRQKVPTILQIQSLECGAASLAMVLASYGRWESLEDMRRACGVNRDGSSLTELMDASVLYGLSPTSHHGTMEDLNDLPMPAILWWNRKHFVVLEGAEKGRFNITDPARGSYAYPEKLFKRNYSGAAITFEVTPEFKKAGKDFNPYGSLRSKLPGTGSGITLAVLAGFLAMLPGLLLAPASQLFVNQVLAGGVKEFLPFLIATMAVIGISSIALTYLGYITLARVQGKIASQNSAVFLSRLLRLPMMYFASRNIGDIVMRCGYNAAVANLLASQLASALISLVAMFAYAALMFYYNVTLAVVVILLSSLNLILLRAVYRRRKVGQALVMIDKGDVQATTISSLQSIETIKSAGLEPEVFAKWADQQTRLVDSQASLVTPTALIGAAPAVLTMLTSVAILIIGGLQVIDGSLTIGGVLAFMALSVGVNGPIRMLVAAASSVQIIGINLQRLDDVMVNPIEERYLLPTDDEEVRAASLRPLTGEVSFKDVVFGYDEGGDPLIQGLSLTLEPGRRVALVGTSGAGKSTIGNLAAGLLIPWSGSITYDGRAITRIAPEILSSQLAKVDQTIMLFKGTVRENVTFWDATVSDELVIAALRDAQILDQVLSRPGGLDCEVLEGGVNFSGGERARLEIARALVRSPNLLILDEATSALDTATEVAVDSAIRSRGCACMIIAHRLSTIRDADEIVVLARGGAVVERGTHDELLAASGVYAELVSGAGSGGNVGT